MPRKRIAQGASLASSSKRSSAAGSRSMHTSVPSGPRRSATRRAWPPAPKVQSTAVSPAPGLVRSISSPARTGTCVRVMSRRIAKALRHLPDLRVEGVLLAVPALLAPHLEVVAHAHHHDLLADPGVAHELRWERDPSGRVQLELPRVALEVARELAVLGAHRIQRAQGALDDRLVVLGGPHRGAGVGVLGQNHSRGERGPEPGGDAEPVLRVQRMFEVAPKCQVALRCASSRRWGGEKILTEGAGGEGARHPRPRPFPTPPPLLPP